MSAGKTSRMKFPVLQGRPAAPANGVCPKCRRRKVMGKRSTPVLMGGAMRVTNKRSKSATVADGCVGFLDLLWHGGEGDACVGAIVGIADWTPGGQFEIYFCSTECLRGFLGACVDELERKVEKARCAKAGKEVRK